MAHGIDTISGDIRSLTSIIAEMRTAQQSQLVRDAAVLQQYVLA
jgi:hypothetical protein